MKPKKNFRSRPKKTGAKKVQRVASQKRRLIEMGYKEEKLAKLTPVEIRDLLKEAGKKKAQKKAAKPKKTKISTKKKV